MIWKPAAGVVMVAMTAMLAQAASGDAKMPGKLILPAAVLPREGSVPVVYRLSQGFTGHATVHVRWTDSLGRVVEDKTIPADLTDETTITFPLDLTRAIAMRNHVEADLTLDGTDVKGAAYHAQEKAAADFVARPNYTGWKDYVVMMWQPYPANLIPELKKLGVNGATYSSRSIALPDFLINTNTRWYSESIATDYYSEYHRWRPDRSVGWSFQQAKALYKQEPDSLEPFKRHPSFWDEYWRKKVHDRALATAQRLAPYRPYFYSLADESGIAELEAQWDFDFSDQSLVPMRRWLQQRYGNLGALNAEWGTHFTNWNLVMPLTTNLAMQRPGNNFAAWADFKEWMDISYADALKMGADAVREGDPYAYVSIGGGQMPGWGGYDYARITQALTAIEPYDIGRSVDIVHSLNPAMPIFSTTFARGPWEKHRAWYELLHGERGLIIWDENQAYVQKDGKPGPRGLDAASYYNPIRDGEGALIINSRPVNNRIAMYYSQPSMRTQWMLERRPDGAAWMTRSPQYERSTNAFMRLRESWCNLIQDDGLQYNFVSYLDVPKGELLQRGYHVLILPEASSLSAAEVKAIREFVADGGVAIASGMPGTYDEHSRELPQSQLDDLFGGVNNKPVNVHPYGQGKAILLKSDVTEYLTARLENKEGAMHSMIDSLLRESGVHPQFAVTDAKGKSIVGLDVHVFANGAVRLLTLQSNPQQRVDELGPPDFRSNTRFEKPIVAHVTLPQPMYVYDTRTRKPLGVQKELTLTVDPYVPTILATNDTPLPSMRVAAPQQVERGSVAEIAVSARPSPADVDVFHVEVRDPSGHRAMEYCGNLIVKDGSGMKPIPFAVNDAPGKWTVTVQDLLSGEVVTRNLDVE